LSKYISTTNNEQVCNYISSQL